MNDLFVIGDLWEVRKIERVGVIIHHDSKRKMCILRFSQDEHDIGIFSENELDFQFGKDEVEPIDNK